LAAAIFKKATASETIPVTSRTRGAVVTLCLSVWIGAYAGKADLPRHLRAPGYKLALNIFIRDVPQPAPGRGSEKPAPFGLQIPSVVHFTSLNDLPSDIQKLFVDAH
jgi:hypothetical protein